MSLTSTQLLKTLRVYLVEAARTRHLACFFQHGEVTLFVPGVFLKISQAELGGIDKNADHRGGVVFFPIAARERDARRAENP